MIVPKEYLNAILNELSNYTECIEVSSPVTGHLFSIEFGERCNVTPVKKDVYEQRLESFIKMRGGGEMLINNVPTFDELKVCFYASSLILSPDFPAMAKTIEDGKNRRLLMGDRPLFIGYDTNSLRHRTNRVVEKIIGVNERINGQKIGYCLSGVVKKELRNHWDKKYGSTELLESLWGRELTRGFLNQPPLKARMARLGAVEYKRIMSNPNCEEIRSRGYGDSAIIESYKRYQEIHDVDMLLLSGDNNFTSMAHEDKMHALYVRQPGKLPDVIDGDWFDIIELLYCLALVFGLIFVGNVYVRGIWSGKGGTEWDNYMLDIDTSDSEISGSVNTDIQILKRVGA